MLEVDPVAEDGERERFALSSREARDAPINETRGIATTAFNFRRPSYRTIVR